MLSRDSFVDQRIDVSLRVQGFHGCVDVPFEGGNIGEGLVGQMMRFEIVPDNLDVVEFGGILGQPLEGQPMLAGLEGCQRGLTDMDRAVVLNQDHRLGLPSGLGSEKTVELFQVRDEVAAALGRTGMHDETASGVIERANQRHFLGLAGRWNAQIGASFCPSARQIGVGQRFAFVAEQQN